MYGYERLHASSRRLTGKYCAAPATVQDGAKSVLKDHIGWV